MSDLVGNPNCWFCHAQAQILCSSLKHLCTCLQIRQDIDSTYAYIRYMQTVQEHITVYLNRLVASLSISWYLYDQIVSDTEPPKFTNCPSILKGYADRSRTSGSVHWNDPLVSDNSGSVSLRQTGGPKSEDDLEVGQYTVTYTAYDGENNTATCSFEVIIKRKHIVSLTLVK